MEPLRVLWCWPVRPTTQLTSGILEIDYFTGAQEELKSAVSKMDAVLLRRGLVLDSSVISAASHLRYILRAGTNTANIDLGAAHEHGILVSATPMHIDISVAEHAIGLMLALARDIVDAHRDVVDAQYQRIGLQPAQTTENSVATNWMGYTHIPSLFGRTLGLVGLGEIGTSVAVRAQAFGMDIAYYRRSRLTPGAEGSRGVRFAPIADLAANSDFVSLHVPETADTAHIIDEAFLRSMRPSAFLVNVSRGHLVDEGALVHALSEHWIAGAGLDVFEQEPLPRDSPLRTAQNVILTPHIGSGTDVGLDLERLVGNLLRVAHRESPNDVLLAS